MKIDLHTHGKLAKKLPFSQQYTKSLFQEAKEANLDAICLTEHFNTLGFLELYNYIYTNYEKVGDCFYVEGIKVFPGMEVDIKEGGHIVVLGQYEDIVELNKELEFNKEKDNFLTFEKLLEKKKQYSVRFIAAHSFREGSNISKLNEELLKQLDGIEINGKDVATKGYHAHDEINLLSQKLKLPIIAGSDTHQSFQYGCIWNEFEKNITTVEDLFEEIYSDRYIVTVSENIKYQVKNAGILKKALKEIHSLGGDYVSIME